MPVDKHRGAILIANLRTAFYIILFWALPSLQAVAMSGLVDPFHVRNMNPFTQIYGLPTASSSHLLASHESYLQLTGDVANNSIQSDSDGERIRLDGETYRLALIWKQGIAEDWQIGVELPYLSHYEGAMDGLIENWHDIFRLSNADREDWPRNRLVYRYENEQGDQVLINRNQDGVGDIVLSLSHAPAWDVGSHRQIALHASLKLPTGDADALLGSGSVDLALWISGAEQRSVWGWPLHIYGQAGILLKGEADLLQDLQRDVVFFGTMGVGWRAYDWLDLKAQVDAHTSHFDSDLDQLGGAALLLTVGGSIHLDGDARRIDISIGENLTTDTVPDFMINLAYVHDFEFARKP
ncbi:MAG: DUF3187 family protein [Candidatus Thiodiazotropha sp.]